MLPDRLKCTGALHRCILGRDFVVHVDEDVILILRRRGDRDDGLPGKAVCSRSLLYLKIAHTKSSWEQSVPQLFWGEYVSNLVVIVFAADSEVHRAIQADCCARRVLEELKHADDQVPQRFGFGLNRRLSHESILKHLDLKPVRRPFGDLRHDNFHLGVFCFGLPQQALGTEPLRMEQRGSEHADDDDRPDGLLRGEWPSLTQRLALA